MTNYAYANRVVFYGGRRYEPGDPIQNHNHAEQLLALRFADREPPAANRRGSSPAPETPNESEED